MAATATNPARVTVSGVIAVLFAAASWATSGIFIKLILASGPVSSLYLAFWRDTAAFALFLLLSLAISPRRLKIRRQDAIWLTGMGISLGVFHVALNFAYRLNGVSITTIQQAAMPAIVLVAARIIWKEPFSGIKIFSLVVISVGTILVSGLLQSDLPEVTIGSILVGFSVPTLYACWSLFGKALRSGYSALTTLTWAFGIAAMVLLPCQLFTGTILPVAVPFTTYLWFAGLICISTAAGFLAFIFALGRLPAGVATNLVMAEIVFAVAYAYTVFNESMTRVDIIGAILITSGVLLTAAERDRIARPLGS
jgi:drug/metabolite transporter (DMT)-like permease